MNRGLFFVLILCIFSCTQKADYDLVLYNAKAYTVDTEQTWAEAIAIKDGRIVAIGTDQDLKPTDEHTQAIDCKGQFLMPGFIEGHGHFAGLGNNLINLNFLRSRSWSAILEMVQQKVAETEEDEWIIGRGWHQEKWDSLSLSQVEGYPRHDELSALSADHPVMLYHASGHSLFANKKAMDLAGISKETASPLGGKIIRDHDGQAIGVFEERAMKLVQRAYEKYEQSLDADALTAKWNESIALAQQACVKNGVTTFQDAGAKIEELEKYAQMAKNGGLYVRLWSMVRMSAEEMKGNLAAIKQIGTGKDFFTCNAIKTEIDGALGSYGAWLLAPYNDKPDFYGQNTTEIDEVKSIAALAKKNEMQLCIHAIGDKANRLSLDIIEEHNQDKEDHRWRIEHAQHLHPDDILRFKSTGTIAAMQAIHCTSDAPFVEKRLGHQRSKEGAYVWQSLLESGAIICNGTDTPVEDVNPLESFYASVTRTRIDNGLSFFTEQKMTRAQALRSYTLDAAYAAFEDHLKGSLSIGKLADLTLVSKNLIECNDLEILEAEILLTVIDGHIRYQK